MNHYGEYREFYTLKCFGKYINSLGELIDANHFLCDYSPDDGIIVFNTKEDLIDCVNYIEKNYPSDFKRMFEVVRMIFNNNDVEIMNKETLKYKISKLKETKDK